METINIYLPSHEVEAFKKFSRKVQKNVPELSVEFSKPYDKKFRHTYTEDGRACEPVVQTHNIVDVTIQLPEVSDWKLLVTYVDGAMFVANPKKELVFKNQQHGASYHWCDVCGHAIYKKTYVVQNVKTGEELQVGGECVKKFGLAGIDWISKFAAELYRTYELYCYDGDDEARGCGWGKDPYAVRCIELNEAVGAAMKYFKDRGGKWSAGHYDNGGRYHTSSSNETIQGYVNSKDYEPVSETYIAELKEYVKKHIEPKADYDYDDFGHEIDRNFEGKISDAMTSFYISITDVYLAFFAIRAFEEWKAAQTRPQYEVGTQVKVDLEIVEKKTFEGYYGMETRYTFKTSDGNTFYRKGKLPQIEQRNGKDFATFYAVIEYKNERGYYLGRATKNAKKDITTIELN